MLLLLALALAVRIHGIWWGVPDLATSPTDPGAPHYYSYHPDEWSILIPAERMNRYGDLNPHFFNYGTLYIYSVAAFIWLARVVGLVELTPGYLGFLYVLARLVAIFYGVLTVWLTYFLGRRLYGRPVGFGAALLLALLPLHVVHSHFAAVDVPVTFWITFSLLAAAHLLAEGTRDGGRGTRAEGTEAEGTRDEGQGTRTEAKGTEDEGYGTRMNSEPASRVPRPASRVRCAGCWLPAQQRVWPPPRNTTEGSFSCPCSLQRCCGGEQESGRAGERESRRDHLRPFAPSPLRPFAPSP